LQKKLAPYFFGGYRSNKSFNNNKNRSFQDKVSTMMWNILINPLKSRINEFLLDILIFFHLFYTEKDDI